jgi:hypothetical protein
MKAGRISALRGTVQRHRWIFVPLLAACSLASAPRAGAATLLQLTTEQMASAATAIVRGTVTGTYVAQSGRTIFTHYSVQVAERWKGSQQATVDVAMPGGSLNGLRQTYVGVPELRAGQQYVLFLWTGTQGPTQSVGLTQGVFNVSAGANGQSVVSRQATGEMMISATGQAVSDQPVTMQLATMRARVIAALGTGQ